MDRAGAGVRCAVYQSQSLPNIYVVVPAQIDPRAIAAIARSYGPFTKQKEIEIAPGSQLIGASADEVLRNIHLVGYHIQGVEIRAHVSEVASAVAGGLLGAAIGAGPLGAIVGAALGAVLAAQNNKKGSQS